MFKSKSTRGCKKIELISVGNMIDLEILMAANSKRVKTEFIGYLKGHYLIINYPNQKALGNAADHIKEGANVIIRAVADHSDGQIIAFKTDVKAISYTPTKLIFLYLPKEIQSHSLRSHVRVPTLIPAKLMTKRSTCNGVIKDISRSGVQFSMLESEVDLPVHDKSCHVLIEGKNKKPIELQGEVCSMVHQDELAMIGIKLLSEETQIEALLQEYLIDLTALHNQQ